MPKNNTDEFVELMSSFQGRLYGLILSLVANPDATNDILQETNLILCRKANEYDSKGHFQGWAFNIARYQVMGHISKFKRSKLFFSPDLIENLAEEALDLKDLDLAN